MAQKVTIQLIDDLDGTAADDISTVRFALDGVSYEIDLTEANAEKLRSAVEEFVNSARRTGGRLKRGTTPATNPNSAERREQTTAIRDWARRNGYELASRGRIPVNVVESFEAAHAGKGKGKAVPAFAS